MWRRLSPAPPVHCYADYHTMSNYCRDKGIKPSDLTEEEYKLFQYDEPLVYVWSYILCVSYVCAIYHNISLFLLLTTAIYCVILHNVIDFCASSPWDNQAVCLYRGHDTRAAHVVPEPRQSPWFIRDGSSLYVSVRT